MELIGCDKINDIKWNYFVVLTLVIWSMSLQKKDSTYLFLEYITLLRITFRKPTENIS